MLTKAEILGHKDFGLARIGFDFKAENPKFLLQIHDADRHK